MTEDHHPKTLEKAYNNPEFLHSSQARTLRLLAEYLEPQARLRRFKIRGTIVFFGSARALPTEELGPFLEDAQSRLATARPHERPVIERQMESAKRLTRFYEDAVRLSSMLTRHFQSRPNHKDRHVICSGGGPGIMEAANRGAHIVGGKTVGLGISLPFEQGNNRYLDPRLAFEFHYFFMRKYWFIYLSKALVVFPGGFGTLDELFEVLTLTQTRKVSRKLPIVLYGSEYWGRVVSFDAMVDWGVINANDKRLFRVCDTPEEAFEYLKTEVAIDGTREPAETAGE